MSRSLPSIEFSQFPLKIERDVLTKCQICREDYNVFRKEHFCKRCLRSVCSDCSPFKLIIYKADRVNKQHHMCIKCQPERTKIEQYIDNNKLSWGEDSDLVDLWLKQLGYKTMPRIPTSNKKLAPEYISELKTLWLSFNFSFRQFIAKLIEKSGLKDEAIMETINWGLEQLRNQKINNLNQVVYLYLYFLCHCKRESALIFTMQVLKLMEDAFTVQEMSLLLSEAGCSEIESYRIEQYLSDHLESIQKKVTVNFLPISVSLQIINMIISNRSSEWLYKGIAIICASRRQFISQNINKPRLISVDILRNCHSIHFRTNVNSTFKKQPSNKFSSDEDTNSGSNYNQVNYKLKCIAQEEEIQTLRKQLTEEKMKHKNNLPSSNPENNKNLSNSMVNFTNSRKNLDHDYRQSYQSIELDDDKINLAEIIQRKNEEIDKIRHKYEEKNKLLEFQKKQLQDANEKMNGQMEVKKLEIRQKQKIIKKSQEDHDSLKSMNSLLLLKLNELSKLLMDQEEGVVKESEEKFSEIRKEIEKAQTGEGGSKQCEIY